MGTEMGQYMGKVKFPVTVMIRQKYVDGVDVPCDGCMGIALREISANTIGTWEVEFMDAAGVQHCYGFDKHNLEIIA